jgi:hypothetical protein
VLGYKTVRRERHTRMAPRRLKAAAYTKPAATLAVDHSAPTTMLETKSPTPFTVASTPKPEPRFAAGRVSEAADFSSDCVMPM